jgi:uncharacterized caspase-like protein
MSRGSLAWLAIASLIAAQGAPAWAQPSLEKRVALVIGIGDYQDPLLGKLSHPKPDAASIAQQLTQLGFEVVTELDVTKQAFLTALDGFAKQHRAASTALVYFTGHGIQIGGQNFLLPTDANFETATTLRNSAVPLEEMLIRVAKVAPSRIILLDACRDDPTQRAPAILKDPAMPVLSGLGRVGRVDGTIVAFSTAPGATAEDGQGDHSPFAQALLAHLGEKGLEFAAVMKLVQMEVYDRTPEHQLPYIEDALPALIFAAPQQGNDPLPERDRLLLAMAKIDLDTRAQVERIAKAKDVPLAPLYGSLFAGAAVTHNDDGERREKLLTQAAEDFINVRANLQTLASSDPEVARLRSEAEHDLSLGAIDAARLALTRAIDIDHAASEALEQRLNTRRLSEAATHAARAGLARTRLAYREAARDLAVAANLAERSSSQQAWRYTLEEADNLRDLGDELGDNATLLEALETYDRALQLAPHGERPLDWATTQNHRGRALAILGWRESGTARLEAAVATDREALGEFAQQRARLDWASTQTNLGNALRSLGEREGDATHLEEAVAAFREALREQTRERAPLDWAKTQSFLAVALWRLGERESGPTHLQEAVAAEREALKELTRERWPLDWAWTQHYLGVTLLRIGQRETGTAHLEEAVAAFREALKERARARVPVAWAMSQHNLANALAALGAREGGTARLEEAVAANREALQEFRRDREPLAWARTQHSLGNALMILGWRESSTVRLEEAVTCLQMAIAAIVRADDPFDWANAQHELGTALTALGQRETGTARLALAIASLNEALKEDTRDRQPLAWASIQYDLGNALTTLGQRETGTGHLKQAVSAYREALKEDTRERLPLVWAAVQNNLGSALITLGQRETGTDQLEEAAAAFREARDEHTRQRMSIPQARNIGNEGTALMLIAERRQDAVMAATAVSRIETAINMARSAGDASLGAFYEPQLAKARAIRDQLSAR